MVESTKKLFEAFDIDPLIQYNRPFYTQCPVCLRPKSLFMIRNRTGIWGSCSRCGACGDTADWLKASLDGKPPVNEYSRLRDLLKKYNSNLLYRKSTFHQEKLLRKLNYDCAHYRTKNPILGVETIANFHRDLLNILKQSKHHWTRSGSLLYFKDTDILVTMPLYGPGGRIQGFSLYNGFLTKNYHMGEACNLYYKQGKHFEPNNVFVAESIPQMMRLQSENAFIKGRSPLNIIHPLYITSARRFYPFSVVQPSKFTVLSYDTPWMLRFAKECGDSVPVTLLSEPCEDKITASLLSDYPHYLINYKKQDALLRRYNDTPPLRLGDNRIKYFVDEDGIYKRHTVKKRKRIATHPIDVTPTDDPKVYKVKIITNARSYPYKAPEAVFKNKKIFNIFLAASYLQDRKAPKLLDVWKEGDILETLMAIQPLTRRFENEKRKERKEKREEQITEAAHSG